MSNQVYDVIVCGAGPVGLFFAYQMIKLGHSVYIHDTKAGPTTQSRAFFVTARSLEMFENKGIAKHILKKAYVLRGAQLIIEGCEVITTFFVYESSHNNFLGIDELC
jgi:2-polyprenyl-6-methoxyphenol hydroxylase-like FAD-dependent oxidoreductase